MSFDENTERRKARLIGFDEGRRATQDKKHEHFTALTARLDECEGLLTWWAHNHRGVSKGGDEYSPPSDGEREDCFDQTVAYLAKHGAVASDSEGEGR